MSGLSSFLQALNADQRAALAKEADTTPAMLDQYAGDHKRPGHQMAQRLVGAAKRLGHQLTLNDCRPDIWKDRKAA